MLFLKTHKNSLALLSLQQLATGALATLRSVKRESGKRKILGKGSDVDQDDEDRDERDDTGGGDDNDKWLS